MKRKSGKINVTRPDRLPDCVTVTQAGGTVLVFRGFCNPNAKNTAEDKFLKVMKAEAA